MSRGAIILVVLMLFISSVFAQEGALTTSVCEVRAKNCEITEEFDLLVKELFEDMLRQPAPYHGKAELEVEKDDGTVKVDAQTSGLTDRQATIFDELEVLAAEIAKGGRDPNKVKTEVEVEKEL